MDRTTARSAAHDLLGATLATSRPPGRQRRAEPMIEAAAAGRPLFKVGGHL